MKSIKDYEFDNVLTIGEPCYYDHKEYTYKGIEDGKHVIELIKKDGIEIKNVDKNPSVPTIPLNIYVRNKRDHSNFGEITRHFQMLDKMYYKISLYNDPFSGYTNETIQNLRDNWEVFEESPYKSVEEIDDLTESIDVEINEISTEMSSLKKKINELNANRKEVTKYCKHKWYKHDEVEVSKNSYEQECECEYCGEEKTIRYYRFG